MLKVGFYEKEITPPLGDDIPGYSGPRNSTTIHDPLFSKAVAIRTGEAVHECIIMISVELIYIPEELYDFVMEKVEKWTLVPQKNIMIAATHTHTGGPTYDDGEFRKWDAAWMETVCHSTADAAIMAYQRMVDASASYASKNVEGLAFCRDYLLKNGEVRTNPKWHDPNIVKPVGTTDPEFPALFFHDTEGKPMGAIVNFACHHDSKAGTEISADYSGVLAAGMKDEFGRQFVNVFFQGCCGNINHCNPFREKLKYDEPNYQRIGKALAAAEKELYDMAQPFEIDAVYAEKRVIPVERRDIPQEMVDEHKWALQNVANDWYQLDINKPDNWMFKRTHARSLIKLAESPKVHAAYIQSLRMGDLSVFALPGEQYVEYGLQIKEKSPTKYNMVSGTALKGIHGYVPTEDVFETTSYAAALGSAPLAPEAGQVMTDAVLAIAQEIDEQAKQ